MNKSESKYFHTALCMDQAFLALLEKKAPAYITVKEICEKAGVNRSTFYLHYESIHDLHVESIQYLQNQFLEHMNSHDVGTAIVDRLRTCPVSELYLVTPEYLRPYLTFIRENKRLFSTVLENPSAFLMEDWYKRLFQNVFIPILERYRVPEADRPYLMAFYIRGLIAIITQWLKGDCIDDLEHIIALTQQCVMTHLQ